MYTQPTDDTAICDLIYYPANGHPLELIGEIFRPDCPVDAGSEQEGETDLKLNLAK